MRASRVSRLVSTVILSIGAILFLYPIWSVVVTSFTEEGRIFIQGTAFWPQHPNLSNFSYLFANFPFLNWYRNSVIVSTLFTIGQLASCSMTAFGLSYFKFRGRNLILVFALASMMLPFQVLMVPMFMIMKTVGWLNTLLPLFVPSFFGDITGAVGIFMLYQAFRQVPRDFAEAAFMDGANPFQIFWKIYLPVARPFITVLAVLSFMSSWNDFARPLVYINKRTMMTVSGGLSYFQTEWQIQWGPVMAGTLLAILPAVLIYIFLQRYFVEIALSSGIKG